MCSSCGALGPPHCLPFLLRFRVFHLVCRKTCLLSRPSAPSLCVTSPYVALIGPPTASRCNGPSVPWVSLPRPLGCSHIQSDATTKRQPWCGCLRVLGHVVLCRCGGLVCGHRWITLLSCTFTRCQPMSCVCACVRPTLLAPLRSSVLVVVLLK